MFTTLLFFIIFLFIWYYLKSWINYFKSGDPKENEENYWMFSYDFKDNENYKNYWDKDIQLLNERKRIRNKLIFLLYIDAIVIFMLANHLVAQMMIFIFN
tara:strand:+ start:213 stop:512 length:300 start_codon:yes stop_codon:yes gene_type:complete